MTDSVVICIPTFKRPKMLKRLLDAIAALETDAALSVLVADNDADGHAGLDLCRGKQDYRWPLRCVIAHKRGIAQVRNTLIEEALATDAGPRAASRVRGDRASRLPACPSDGPGHRLVGSFSRTSP